jgi:uncharacterized protein (DUF1330 family)
MALGYLFVRSKIIDSPRYERSRSVISRLAQSYGGRNLIRSTDVKVLHGSYDGLLLAVWEFPSVHAVELFTSSPEYTQLRDDLVAAGVADLWIVPGL